MRASRRHFRDRAPRARATLMRLSIVIPALDEEVRRHHGALAALAAAARRGHEVIVVDGGSRDATLAIARAGRRPSPSSRRAGRAAQMNAGAARARGDVLLFLHADSRLPERAAPAIARRARGGRALGPLRRDHRRPPAGAEARRRRDERCARA